MKFHITKSPYLIAVRLEHDQILSLARMKKVAWLEQENRPLLDQLGEAFALAVEAAGLRLEYLPAQNRVRHGITLFDAQTGFRYGAWERSGKRLSMRLLVAPSPKDLFVCAMQYIMGSLFEGDADAAQCNSTSFPFVVLHNTTENWQKCVEKGKTFWQWDAAPTTKTNSLHLDASGFNPDSMEAAFAHFINRQYPYLSYAPYVRSNVYGLPSGLIINLPTLADQNAALVKEIYAHHPIAVVKGFEALAQAAYQAHQANIAAFASCEFYQKCKFVKEFDRLPIVIANGRDWKEKYLDPEKAFDSFKEPCFLRKLAVFAHSTLDISLEIPTNQTA